MVWLVGAFNLQMLILSKRTTPLEWRQLMSLITWVGGCIAGRGANINFQRAGILPKREAVDFRP